MSLPTYVSSGISSASAGLQELVLSVVPVAVALVILCIGPRVLIRMIRGMANKVEFDRDGF
jgi:hypothetical protein